MAQLDQQRTKRQYQGRRVILFDEDGNRIEEDEDAPATPSHLADAVRVAVELDELREMKAMPPYPAQFTPFEWTCFRALIQARRIDQEKDGPEKADPAGETPSAHAAYLDRLRRR